jgi:hypothetical protein
MLVTPVVPYLSIRLAGCSVDLEISRGAGKQARTPQGYKKKKKEGVFNSNISI